MKSNSLSNLEFLAIAFDELQPIIEWVLEQECACIGMDGLPDREPEVCMPCYARSVFNSQEEPRALARATIENYTEAEIARMEAESVTEG